MIYVAPTQWYQVLQIEPATDQLDNLDELRNIAKVNLEHSTESLTFSWNGEPLLAIIGIVEMNHSERIFATWAIVSKHAKKYGVSLTRKVLEEIDQAGTRHNIKTLTMMVHSDNEAHVDWAETLGFYGTDDGSGLGIGASGRNYNLMTRYWI